jgi:hypothetical protein
MIIRVKEVFGKALTEFRFVGLIVTDSIKNILEAWIIFGYHIDEETIQEVIEIMVTGVFGELVFKDTRKIKVIYERYLQW